MNCCAAYDDLQRFLPLGGAYISLSISPLLWLFAPGVDCITTDQSAQPFETHLDFLLNNNNKKSSLLISTKKCGI